jgi:hypothetical protein
MFLKESRDFVELKERYKIVEKEISNAICRVDRNFETICNYYLKLFKKMVQNGIVYENDIYPILGILSQWYGVTEIYAIPVEIDKNKARLM